MEFGLQYLAILFQWTLEKNRRRQHALPKIHQGCSTHRVMCVVLSISEKGGREV